MLKKIMGAFTTLTWCLVWIFVGLPLVMIYQFPRYRLRVLGLPFALISDLPAVVRMCKHEYAAGHCSCGCGEWDGAKAERFHIVMQKHKQEP